MRNKLNCLRNLSSTTYLLREANFFNAAVNVVFTQTAAQELYIAKIAKIQ